MCFLFIFIARIIDILNLKKLQNIKKDINIVPTS